MQIPVEVNREMVATVVDEYLDRDNPSVLIRAVAEGVARAKLRLVPRSRKQDAATLRVWILELEQLARLMQETEGL